MRDSINVSRLYITTRPQSPNSHYIHYHRELSTNRASSSTETERSACSNGKIVTKLKQEITCVKITVISIFEGKLDKELPGSVKSV